MAKVANIKTKETGSSVDDFINSIADEQKQKDSFAVLELMQKATEEQPKMWGSSIIGFGNQRFKSPATGREVDWFVVGFSPRKANLSLYLLNLPLHAATLEKFGKHKTGGGCVYINKLSDVDVKVLAALIKAAVKTIKEKTT